MAARLASHDYSYPPTESCQEDVVTSGPYGYAFQSGSNQQENVEQSNKSVEDKPKNAFKRKTCLIILFIILAASILVITCCLVLLVKDGTNAPPEKQSVQTGKQESFPYSSEKPYFGDMARNKTVGKVKDITNKIDRLRKLRIVGGKTSKEGRVEVLHNDLWGTVCDDNWGLKEASIVCESLGYSVALVAPGSAHFGPGNGNIWLDDVSCIGIEADISECIHSGWGNHNCQHDEDASVICEGH